MNIKHTSFFQIYYACYFETGSVAEYYESNVYTWFDLALASALPFIIILTCNIAMIIQLKKTNKARIRMQSSLQTNDINITNLTIMLLTVSFTFVITSLPICIFLLIEHSLYVKAVAAEDYFALANLELVKAIVHFIWYMNFAINFFVYVLRGQRFREEVCTMFTRNKCCYAEEEEQAPVTVLTAISS